MSKKQFKINLLITFSAAILSGIFFYLSDGAINLGFFAWIAPVPILVVLKKINKWQALVIGYIAYLIGMFNFWPIIGFTFSNIFFFAVAMSIYAFQFGVILFILKVFENKISSFSLVFLFPALCVLFEYVSSNFSPHGTFGSAAYTQFDWLSFIQLLSLTGLWGLTFLIRLTASALAFMIINYKNIIQIIVASIIVLFSLFFSLYYGHTRLSLKYKKSEVKVATLTMKVPIQTVLNPKREEIFELVESFKLMVGEASKMRARIVVWPEKSIGVTNSFKEEFLSKVKQISLIYNVYQIIAFDDVNKNLNTAIFISPSGKLLATYYKHHLVPGFESGYFPGKKVAIVDTEWGRVGIAICRDMDFLDVSKEYGKKGVDILFVPARDFKGSEKWHSKIALFRGIEQGFSIIRSANEGISIISDPFGRIIKKEEAFQIEKSILIGDVPSKRQITLYSRWGDWFVYLILFLLLGIVLEYIVRIIRARAILFILRGKKGGDLD